MKRLTIRLDDELHRELRHYAVEQRESVQKIVERVIRQAMPSKYVIRYVDTTKSATRKPGSRKVRQ